MNDILIDAVAAFLWETHGGLHYTWEQKSEQSRDEWRDEALRLLRLPEFDQWLRAERQDAIAIYSGALDGSYTPGDDWPARECDHDNGECHDIEHQR